MTEGTPVTATPTPASPPPSTATAPTEVAPVRVHQGGWSANYRGVKVVLQRELIRFGQDKTRVISALIQPVLFLFVLGNGLSSLTNRATGGIDLKTFMFPGVLATSTLFTAVFSAVSIVWDREFGFLREMLVAPVSRASIMIGKALGGATVATIQGCLVLVLAGLVGVPYDAVMLAKLVVLLFLLSFMLTSLGLVIAARIQQMQAVMGIMQMLLLPLSFLSGALYPTRNLPTWLAYVVKVNPITYAVHAVRSTVFDHLDANPLALRALNPDITWGGWVVPRWFEVGVIVVVGGVLLGLAIAQFRNAE